MSDDSQPSDKDSKKQEQAKKLVNDLIKSIRQSLEEEEYEKAMSEQIGKSILLQAGAVTINGRLTFVI